ncbi:MAG: DUF6567 family protein [Chitinophagales bacterium]
MRNFFLIFLSGVLLTSCVSSHGGAITSSVALNQDNFFIEESVSGSATATYILGFGGNDQIALVAQAKRDLLNKTNFSLGSRALVNEVLDFKIQNILGVVTKVTATVTAEVVNFDLSQKPDVALDQVNNQLNEVVSSEDDIVKAPKTLLDTVLNTRQQLMIKMGVDQKLTLSNKSEWDSYIDFLDKEYFDIQEILVNQLSVKAPIARKILRKCSDVYGIRSNMLRDLDPSDFESIYYYNVLLREIYNYEKKFLEN